MASTLDVFISYGHEDVAWVRLLAENLHRAGFEVFFDEWDILAGDVRARRLEEGIGAAAAGIVVLSPTSVRRPWVNEEYFALLVRTVAGQQRLIPVLLGDVDLPPFLAGRVSIDFRDADGPEYERRLADLVRALRGESGWRPEREGLVVAPGSAFRGEGARRAKLSLTRDRVLLAFEGREVSHRPGPLTHRLEGQLWQLERARQRVPTEAELAVRAPTPARADGDPEVHRRLLEVGRGLGEAFLSGAGGTALAKAIQSAERSNARLELALEVADEDLAEWPWETLSLPGEDGGPLVLHPRVALYRSIPGLGPTPAVSIRGPLRILVAIGSPERGGGELLDTEAELARILEAVDAARRQGKAFVHILNRGTVDAIHAALQAQRFHVLHISCHARPGALVLEDDEGNPDLVDAERFAADVLVPGHGVPMMVLSGCSTALANRQVRDIEPADEGQEQPDEAAPVAPVGEAPSEEGEAALAGLARQLLGRGVPTVLAMTAPVTDLYATWLGEQLYRQLATQQRPDPLAALSEARRRIEAERRRLLAQPNQPANARQALLAEWATPALFLRGPNLPLFDPAESFETLREPAQPHLPGVVIRGVGDFVGRRREQRQMLRALRSHRAGLVLHGIGGVGKSTLAAQVVADLGDEAGLVASVAGETTADEVLDTIGRALFAACISEGLDERHPLRALAGLLRDASYPWGDRLDLLARPFPDRKGLLVLLDNFEDNLAPSNGSGRRIADAELADFLTAWVGTPGKGRLLITSRYPFQLPNGAERHLELHHLGPLSPAETRKLIWRLPGLDALPAEQQQRSYIDVGGHPRTLEYLDALLRGGQARFDDIAERMERALEDRGIARPQRWLRSVEGDLDRALAEAVTLAVDDVLLGRLLEQIGSVPLARELLTSVSVYRQPVDRIGVAWQVAEEIEPRADPARDARLAKLSEALQAAHDGTSFTGLEDLGFTPDEQAQFHHDLAELRRPPLRVVEDWEPALDALTDLGLIARLDAGGDRQEAQRYLVHRWTARALARQATAPELAAAHHHAAAYLSWRVRVWPQNRQDDISQLIEARYHYHAAGEIDQAVNITLTVGQQLFTWGAWSWEERLYREALTWEAVRSNDTATLMHQLGNIAERRGNYDRAEDWYRRSLTLMEELGDRAGMAHSYHQLGMVAQNRGDYDRAEDWSRQSLTLMEELGDRAGMAHSYHQLGMVAQNRGDYDRAEDWYRRALTLMQEVGDRAGLASTYGELGKLAERREAYDEALNWYRQTLAISTKLGDRVSISYSYNHLGTVAQSKGDYDQALYWYRQSLAIKEELGDRSGMANTMGQLGLLAQLRGDLEQAIDWSSKALEIVRDLGDHRRVARGYNQLGALLTESGSPDVAVPYALAGLLLRAAKGYPGLSDSIQLLGRQRELLGDTRFSALLREHVDDETATAVLQRLGPGEV